MSHPSTEQLTEIYLMLLKNEFISFSCGSWSLTPKFMAIVDTNDAPGIDGQQFKVVLADNWAVGKSTLTLGKDWTLNFMNFIIEAKVPRQLEGSRGEVYTVNNYSEPAKKVFQKAIEKEGVVYEILVKSTMLYYKSNNKFKKNVGNYFIQGDWRSDYQNLLEAANTGTIEQHIKSEIDNGSTSYYDLG